MKIIQIKKISDVKHLNLFSVQYKDRKKNHKQWIFSSRSQLPNPLDKDPSVPDAVVIVPYHVIEKKLVIIKEFRVCLNGYQYGFPAGLLDKNETIEQAGRRELWEETGLNMTKILKISPPVYSSSGMTDESVSLLFTQCEGTPTNSFAEPSEEIEVMMVSQQQAADLLLETDMKFDVKSWIILNAFAATGLI